MRCDVTFGDFFPLFETLEEPFWNIFEIFSGGRFIGTF